MKMHRKISVALPYYNGASYIRDTLDPLVSDDRIGEIIITDDQSNDTEELIKILHTYSSPKIKFHRNDDHLEAYHNKLNAVSKCTYEWTLLLDSDNIADTAYFDTLYKIKKWDPNILYHAMWAKTFKPAAPEPPSPNLNYSTFSNKIITPDLFIENFPLDNFQCLINNGNYFFPTKPYLSCMSHGQQHYQGYMIHPLDAVVPFTDWLCAGKKILIVPDLIYHHRLHETSLYARESDPQKELLAKNWLFERVKKSKHHDQRKT